QAGNITWETYPRLFPQNIESSSVASFDSLSGALPSPGSKYYAFLEQADDPTITLAPLDSDEIEIRRIIIPTEVSSAPDADKKSSSYQLLLWSGNQKFVLLKHSYTINDDKQLEWILVNTSDPTASVNINDSYGIQPDDIIFG